MADSRLDGVDVVYFDVDDTLYDFDDSLRRTLVHLRGRHPELLGGYPDEDLVRAYHRANGTLTSAEKLALIHRDPWRYRRATWEAFIRLHDGPLDGDPRSLAGDLAREFGEWRFANLRESAFPGALETVRDLQRRFKVGIITNGPSPLQRSKIEALGVADLLPADMIFVSGEFGCNKPHPDIFHAAVERGGAAHERTVLIGDSLECDVPCRGVGMRAVLFHGKAGELPDLSSCPHAPDHVARSYEDVRALLGC